MKIEFVAGLSRHGDYGVNYLISEDHELYAEVKVPDGASDDYGYLTLKAEIMRQASEHEIPADKLEFWYDGCEDKLEADASAECEVKGW